MAVLVMAVVLPSFLVVEVMYPELLLQSLIILRWLVVSLEIRMRGSAVSRGSLVSTLAPYLVFLMSPSVSTAILISCPRRSIGSSSACQRSTPLACSGPAMTSSC